MLAADIARYIKAAAHSARQLHSHEHACGRPKARYGIQGGTGALPTLSGIKAWFKITDDATLIRYIRALVALGTIKSHQLHPVARQLCQLDSIDQILNGANPAADARLLEAVKDARADSMSASDPVVKLGPGGDFTREISAAELLPTSRSRIKRLPASDLRRLADAEAAGKGGEA